MNAGQGRSPLLLVALLVVGSATLAAAQPPVCDDYVYGLVDGDRVTVVHQGAEYNCCPDHFAYQLVAAVGVIRVTEIEVEGEPCDCICCFDLRVTIAEVPAGAWTVLFRWYDYGTWTWLEWPLQVVVPEAGQSGLPAVADAEKSECYWGTSVVPDPSVEPGPGPAPGSWGAVKSLYR
ncbi:MAG: hypothetical protein ABIF77_02235 [bacterium]